MDMQHDSIRFGRGFMENPRQRLHDKLHRRVIIIVHDNPEHRRPLDLRASLKVWLRMIIEQWFRHLFCNPWQLTVRNFDFMLAQKIG